MHRTDAGWFGPGSATWRINRGTALLLGGGRALILQVAHPRVGAGVEHYSRFRTDRWGRLTHTLDTMGQIIFGDDATARRGAARMRRAHARIQGVVGAGSEAGSPYDANDPALILWVWATLVDTSLVTYDRYVRPLDPVEVAAYYDEQKRFAHACGVPVGDCPATFADFTDYVRVHVDRTLEPTAAARHVADVALNPLGLPRAATPLLALIAAPTVGLLPQRLRDDLGLRWSPRRDRLLRAGASASRRTLPLLPARLRHVHSAREATARTRARRRESAGLVPRDGTPYRLTSRKLSRPNHAKGPP